MNPRWRQPQLHIHDLLLSISNILNYILSRRPPKTHRIIYSNIQTLLESESQTSSIISTSIYRRGAESSPSEEPRKSKRVSNGILHLGYQKDAMSPPRLGRMLRGQHKVEMDSQHCHKVQIDRPRLETHDEEALQKAIRNPCSVARSFFAIGPGPSLCSPAHHSAKLLDVHIVVQHYKGSNFVSSCFPMWHGKLRLAMGFWTRIFVPGNPVSVIASCSAL